MLAPPCTVLISSAGISFDPINRGANGFEAANRTPAWSGKALALLKNKAAVEAARSTGNECGSISEGPLDVGQVLVHLFFANAQQTGNVPRGQLTFSKYLQ
jgi:hypothetical protein